MDASRSLYALQNTAGPGQELHENYHRAVTSLSDLPSTYTRVRAAQEPSLSCSSTRARFAEKPALAPLSLPALLQLAKGYMELGVQRAHFPPRPQQVFRDAILAEVKRVWKDVQRSQYDPLFRAHTCHDLYQQLLAYVGLVCRHLYLHYLSLMEHRRAQGIFTDCANLTRFCVQISLDCSKLLNMAVVRRRLLGEARTLQGHRPRQGVAQLAAGPLHTQTLGCHLGFTIGYFVQLSRPHMLTLSEKIAKDIKELENLPSLDLSKIKQLIQMAPRPPSLREMSCSAITTPCSHATLSGDKTRPGRSQQGTSTILKRSQSLPNMRFGKLLADELGIHLSPRPLSPDLPFHYSESTEDELKGFASLAEDLRRLVHRSVLKSSKWSRELDEDSELPPLIKALTFRKTNEVRLEQLKRTLSTLRQEEAREKKQRQTIISAPATHPQATTLNVRIHDRMVVKAADLQVSERAYLDDVTLEKFPPLYNHLLGEIDNAAIKALDANLFAGVELREIYAELMNTIPKDHLQIGLGSLLEPAAANIPRSSCFASSTLTRKKNEQIINEELNQILPAGPFTPDEMVDTTTTPNLPFKKSGAKGEYVSWLRWWKATFNIDDYLKCISTKETDFLQVIFHLYFSTDAEDEEGSVADELEIKKQVEMKREALKKAVEQQFEKEEYESGMWNSNTIMLGGLGAFASCDHGPEDLRVLQRRLERLWTVLHFSSKERMDMAVKYSSNKYYWLLPDMLQAWEMAAQAVQERELLLAELEKFEQRASDPNRFFKRAPKSFASRLQESRTRSHLHYQLSLYNSDLNVILSQIKETFNDVVTFKGRPYMEKMEWDTVEMLYWLQQERRADSLKKEDSRRSQHHKLPPLT